MRKFLSKACVAAAVATAALGIPATWLQNNIVSENGYVGMVNNLGVDQNFRQGMADATAKTAVNQIPLPDAVKSIAQPAISDVTSQVTDDQGFPQAWRDVAHLSHVEFFGSDQDKNQSTELSFDAGPLAKLVQQNIKNSTGLDFNVSDTMPIKLTDFDTRPIAHTLTTWGAFGPWLLGASGVFALGAFVFSPNRGKTIRNVSLALLGTVIVIKFIALGLIPYVLQGQDPSPIAAQFLTGMKQVITGSSDSFLMKIGLGSIVGIVGGSIVSLFSRSSSKNKSNIRRLY